MAIKNSERGIESDAVGIFAEQAITDRGDHSREGEKPSLLEVYKSSGPMPG
jgi:hypothetical protein